MRGSSDADPLYPVLACASATVEHVVSEMKLGQPALRSFYKSPPKRQDGTPAKGTRAMNKEPASDSDAERSALRPMRAVVMKS